jgi:cadmium resistance protein CadD (predicted permease)
MLIQAVMTAGGAFAATNVDDILILSLFCARLPHWRQALPLLLGKSLGFSVLVLISLLGLLGPQLLAPPWLGLLGLVPISLGLWRWRQRHASPALGQDELAPPHPGGQQVSLQGGQHHSQQGGQHHTLQGGQHHSTAWSGLLTMAGLTLANGADNVGVYLPLFAQSGGLELAVTLLTFAVGLALLGLLAWVCSRTPGLASLLGRLGETVVPLVLILLGTAILLDGLALDAAELVHLPGLRFIGLDRSGLRPPGVNPAGLPLAVFQAPSLAGGGLNGLAWSARPPAR